MAARGYYQNPVEKSCWETCNACFRCEAKGTRAACNNCSGRFDMHGVTDPHPDDYCDCRNGVLNYVKQNGKRVRVKYRTNPYSGKVIPAESTQDEKDWEEYVRSLQEKYDDEYFDPLTSVVEQK